MCLVWYCEGSESGCRSVLSIQFIYLNRWTVGVPEFYGQLTR